jgi:hypothetical protein
MMQAFKGLPRYVVLDVREAFRILDDLAKNQDLPIIDIDATLSALVDVLYKPTINRSVSDTIRFVINEVVGVANDDMSTQTLLTIPLSRVVHALLQEFTFHRLYIENRLLYDYDRRFTTTAALLRRKDDCYL